MQTKETNAERNDEKDGRQAVIRERQDDRHQDDSGHTPYLLTADQGHGPAYRGSESGSGHTPYLLTADQIEQILPHRYPFLLVDRITDMEPGIRAEGIKCVSANEPFFQGHFPGQKIMPGVLILEALAQTGAVAILSKEENAGKLVLFGGVNKARFRSQVTPGDVLTLRCRIEKQKGAVGIGVAEASVNGKIAVKAELVFAISERNSYDRDCESK